ncbi:MAG: 2-C-methyl-D-erythritol 2,4-cyclodiphosphate synthase [Erysipelotrichaceae bacterium]|nr:2-C-methyl-D-erythritol 2,4-cyclodiphosphate synthase [Erysipelotrichaceae bacterium]MBR5048098.1 2-C-methyl-D-erythritol 2,4-cyclodiphosphate synthase [Erysipelotrichaceae bacterium]
MKIGQATDIHRLVENRPLILGGVRIEYEKGLLGHSDADVLTHAVAESIIGALGLGDLGTHFPDTDPAYEGISSLIILERVFEMMDAQGYRIGNVDATVMIEKPKLAAYKKQMEENLAAVLRCEPERINVKATRGEGLGFIGRGEGVQAFSVCLLEEKE